MCIIFLQLGLLDDAITHTKDILQKGMANSKVLEFFFFKVRFEFLMVMVAYYFISPYKAFTMSYRRVKHGFAS